MANRNTLLAGVCLALASLTVSPASTAQNISPTWKQDIKKLLEKYVACTSASPTDTYACSAFISESLNKIYKINGLYSDKSKRYLQLKELAVKFEDPTQWTLLGHAYDQKVLDESQSLANANKAVVAVYKTAEGVSHVAIILPGEVQFS